MSAQVNELGGTPFHDVVIVRIRMVELVMDRYQRPFDLAWGNRISKQFKSELCEPLVVNRREDGTLACVDGQHRAKALILRFGRDVAWPCRVLSGLSFEEEARLFTELNEKRKSPSVVVRFNSALLANDPEAVRVAEIVESHGFRVRTPQAGHSSDDNYISAIGSLLKVFREHGEDRLIDVLSLYAEAFGNRPAPATGELHGLASMLSRYREQIDRRRLVKAMKATTVSRWRADALDMKRVLGASEGAASGMVMVRNYNRGLRENLRLPDWSLAGQAMNPSGKSKRLREVAAEETVLS